MEKDPRRHTKAENKKRVSQREQRKSVETSGKRALGQQNIPIAIDSPAWIIPASEVDGQQSFTEGDILDGTQQDKEALAQMLEKTNAKQIATVATIGIDEYWKTDFVTNYINDSLHQVDELYLHNLVKHAKDEGYTGVMLDIETIQSSNKQIRAAFVDYVNKLMDIAHDNNMVAGITLIHKTADPDVRQDTVPYGAGGKEAPYTLNAFQDWEALNKLTNIDFIDVMTIDQYSDNPGPVTSWPWIEKNIDYLFTHMPDQARKIVWQLPLNGKQWQNINGVWQVSQQDVLPDGISDIRDKLKQEQYPFEEGTDPSPYIKFVDGKQVQNQIYYSTPESLVQLMEKMQSKMQEKLQDLNYKLPVAFYPFGDKPTQGFDEVIAQFYQ
jgi:spore germination protein YaaH